jgi:hypothetical protein
MTGSVIGVVRVAGQKLILDTLYDGVVIVGCSGSVDKVLLEVTGKLVALCCTGLAEVRCGLGLGAL